MTDEGRGTSDGSSAESTTFEALTRFARAIAHDLNNFLSAIRGSAELLNRQLGTENPLVHEIKEASDQASSLTQQVIRLSEAPVEDPRTRSGSEGGETSESRPRPDTILVVLSQQSVRILLIEFLSAYGYHVLQASGPETAVEIGRSYEGDIDALLVELALPSCQGPELVSRLAEMRGAVPTIYVADPDVQPSFSEGDATLRKPLRPSELKTTLDHLLER